MGIHTEAVQKLYVAYFNRPADFEGLAFWEGVVAGANGSTAAVSAAFAASQEYKDTYAGKSPYQIVNAIYNNLFGRDAETAGLTFWGDNLRAGKFTIDQAVTIIAGAAKDQDLVAYNNKVTAATRFSESLDTASEIIGYSGTIANNAAKQWLSGVTTKESLDAALQPAALAATVNAVSQAGIHAGGVTHTLTTGQDTFNGGANNDLFIANAAIVINPADGTQSLTNTLQSVDKLNGGAGVDTLQITSANGTAVALAQLTSVEIVEASSLAGLTINTAAAADVTKLSISKVAGAIDATAGAGTDVIVSQAAVGATVEVAGGKNVAVALTDVASATNTVNIGVGTKADATGAVSVSLTGAAYTDATGNTNLSAVNVTGGSTISVTQKATSNNAAAAADLTNATITQGNVLVTGNSSTTAVTVKQDATVAAAPATYKTGGVTETASVKFGAIKAGDVLTVAGLVFTASADMTAEQVAAAFANIIKGAAYGGVAAIPAGDTQSGGAASKGTYTGIASGWTSAAASGDTVVFTTTGTANTDVANLDLVISLVGAGVAPLTTTTQGKPHNAGAAGGVMGVETGTVTVDDASGTIKTITIDGYKTGSAITGGAVLETLNLSNSDTNAALTVADTAATLALNLEKVATGSTIAFAAAPTTLNVKSTGANTAILTAAATTALNVSGTGVLTTGASNLSGVKNIVVTETAGLNLTNATLTALESVNATATTGAITATIDGDKTAFASGAGKDVVILAGAIALTKAINLGAGDDSLSFGALAVTGSSVVIDGGAGTDTLSMTTAAAGGLDGAAVTFYTGFERLTISDAGAADTIDLANLGFTNYVTTTGSAGTLTLDKLANNGTVVVAAAATTSTTVQIANAATGTADVLNLVLGAAAGTVTAANIETVNVSATANASLNLAADKATTVNVSGAKDVNLTLTNSTKVTLVDGSTLTGGLTVTSANTTSATTIKGGAGADILTAAAGTTADVLNGGAGNDVLVGNAGLTTLTGGAGADTFVVNAASLNVNSYATITDFSAGDLLQFAGATAFKAAKIALGDTAVFQDYANAAMNTILTGEVAWFQFNGNTYVVMDAGAESATFVEGQDFIVKLTGTVDLTNASFNALYDTIGLV
ncbi:MAG: DUF4214 domain-containing protein [Telluria sp.]